MGNRETSWAMVVIQARNHEALAKAKVLELEKIGQIHPVHRGSTTGVECVADLGQG